MTSRIRAWAHRRMTVVIAATLESSSRSEEAIAPALSVLARILPIDFCDDLVVKPLNDRETVIFSSPAGVSEHLLDGLSKDIRTDTPISVELHSKHALI